MLQMMFIDANKSQYSFYLIENLKEKNTTWSNTMLDCERSVSRTLFMDENSDRNH